MPFPKRGVAPRDGSPSRPKSRLWRQCLILNPNPMSLWQEEEEVRGAAADAPLDSSNVEEVQCKFEHDPLWPLQRVPSHFKTKYDGIIGKKQSFKGIASIVKPSKTLTLRELIQRDQSHLLSPANSEATPYYNEDEVIPDFSRMEKTDILMWKTQLDERLAELNAEVAEELNTNKKRRAEAKRKADEAARKDEPPAPTV